MRPDTIRTMPGPPPSELPPELERELRRLMRRRDRAADAFERALDAALEAGASQTALAKFLGVSRQAVAERARRRRETVGDKRRSEVKSSDAHGLENQDQP